MNYRSLSDFYYFSGRFDTSRSMIALSVFEISGCDAFCGVQEQEELGILEVG